jgi:hypothetical protein
MVPLLDVATDGAFELDGGPFKRVVLDGLEGLGFGVDAMGTGFDCMLEGSSDVFTVEFTELVGVLEGALEVVDGILDAGLTPVAEEVLDKTGTVDDVDEADVLWRLLLVIDDFDDEDMLDELVLEMADAEETDEVVILELETGTEVELTVVFKHFMLCQSPLLSLF